MIKTQETTSTGVPQSGHLLIPQSIYRFEIPQDEPSSLALPFQAYNLGFDIFDIIGNEKDPSSYALYPSQYGPIYGGQLPSASVSAELPDKYKMTPHTKENGAWLEYLQQINDMQAQQEWQQRVQELSNYGVELPTFTYFKPFTMDDFTYSDILRQYNAKYPNKQLSNAVPEKHQAHAQEAIDVLNNIQQAWGSELVLSSGYRSPELNKALREWGYSPSATSAHMRGSAIDFHPEDRSMNMEEFGNFVKNYLAENGIKYDQLLMESDSQGRKWIHLGLYNNLGQQRGKVKRLHVR